MTKRSLPPGSELTIWLSIGTFTGVYVALRYGAGLPVADSAMTTGLLVAMPAVAMLQVPLLANAEIDRIPAYWSSILALWILGTLCWLVGTREGGLDAIGFVLLAPGRMAIATVGLVVAVLVAIVVFRRVALMLGMHDTEIVKQLMPHTPEEKGVFVVLSIAAGVGEEVAYRGYAIPVLIPIVGPLGAVLITSGVFGVLHVYQGVLGVVRTSLIGALLAVGFLVSGSVIPVMIAHTVIDVLAGIYLADRLLIPEAPAG